MQASEKAVGTLIRPEEIPEEADPRAEGETRGMAAQDLGAESLRSEHRRKEKLRNVFAAGVRALIIVIFVLIGIALLLVAWHYLGLERYKWIPDEDMKTVSTVLFSGTLFVFLGLYVRDRV